jgi:holo-[acyl-carrier protein] synthase
VIFGIGTDLIRIERFEHALDNHGDRFAERILMPEELEGYWDRKFKARYLAMRFAGKEAVAKSLGTGFANGIWVRDIGIVHNARGKPDVVFSERGVKVCSEPTMVAWPWPMPLPRKSVSQGSVRLNARRRWTALIAVRFKPFLRCLQAVFAGVGRDISG